MANHRSAEKRIRVSEKKRLRNKSIKTSTRNSIRNFKASLEAGNPEATQTALKETLRKLDKAVSKGVLHKNAAARMKSRLTRKTNTAGL